MSTAAVDKSGERVRQMFGEIAPSYDRMNHLLSMNVDRYWRWRTVRKLRRRPLPARRARAQVHRDTGMWARFLNA